MTLFPYQLGEHVRCLEDVVWELVQVYILILYEEGLQPGQLFLFSLFLCMVLCPTIVVLFIFLQVIPLETPYIVSVHHLVKVHPGFSLFIESAILLQSYLPAITVYPDI